ncbi:hypothetical protein [Caulobacter sp. NIBR2454]|uniref:hypothetical protein n=1 Tax=Caulobacter sp. NIBR2454 TaxID=3015996 RepID=UPI0022B6FE13|nr:hypothetical protein [Caulobacter sp. NIBR2454]
MTASSNLLASLQSAMTAAAAEAGGVEPVSITIDYGEAAAAEGASAEATVERATRTLVFIQARAVSPEGAVAAAASAIFRIPTAT